MDKKIIPLDTGWRFRLGDAQDTWYGGFDDEDFRPVTIPHDWAVEAPFSPDNSSGTGYLPGGIGWYRLRFTVPDELREKRLRITFDGVCGRAQVWLNSYHLGGHVYSYTPFSFDVTDLVRFENRENVLCLRAAHEDVDDSRWYTGSGLTRRVFLTAEEPLHAAENGVWLETLSIDGNRTDVAIHIDLQNDSPDPAAAGITALLRMPDGSSVLSIRDCLTVDPWEKSPVTLTGCVCGARLWDVDDPFLYTQEIWADVCDSHYLLDRQTVGLRTAQFSPDNGFILNGKQMKLKGVCLHHDGGCLGAAVPAEVWQRRLLTLQGCGCNAIRCSHNPHAPELYDLCDRLGILVMDEAFDEWENPKNKWTHGHNVYPPCHHGYAEDFPEWHERDLRAMVRRDRRHPSVILYSLGNEIDYPNDPYCSPLFSEMTGNNDASKPASERLYDPEKPDIRRLMPIAGELAAIAQSEDNSRPAIMALAFPELSVRLGILDILDGAGYNYKEHLYDRDHAEHPDVPLLGSETGHSWDAWLATRDRPFVAGQFLWTGVDYLGEARGWPVHGSGAGLLDLAGFAKERYWFRRSVWSSEPLVSAWVRAGHTPPARRWNYTYGEPVEVWCSASTPRVQLSLNGTVVGEAEESDRRDGRFVFSIPYAPGVLCVKGLDRSRCVLCEDKLETDGPSERCQLSLWEGTDAVTGRSFAERSAEPGYTYQLELELLDADGRHSFDDKLISVAVDGPGELQGMENGDLADNTAYSVPERRTSGGRLIVYIRRTGSGDVNVQFHSGALEPAGMVLGNPGSSRSQNEPF